jgi:AbrB family looped-hinge helix DNA binding protein
MDEQAVKARVSSKGQIAIPKRLREKFGLAQGTDLQLRIEGDEIILRKIPSDAWRKWEGRFKDSDLLGDLIKDRREETLRDTKGCEPCYRR